MTEFQTQLPNIQDIETNAKKAFYRKKFTEESYFQNTFKCDSLELNCEPFATLLRDEITRLLFDKGIIDQPTSLENLHTLLSDEMRAYTYNDGVNLVSKQFYENDDVFTQAYLSFVKDFVAKHICPEPFYFQETPTIRLHCPNAENSHHYPRYHTDIGYGHPPEEINLWLPLTAPQPAHGFRLCSLEDTQKILGEFDYDFAPFIDRAINNPSFNEYCTSLAEEVKTDFGKLLIFDSRCVHSGIPLYTHTRASIDIRIMPVREYQKLDYLYQGAGRRKIKFIPGECYHTLSSDLL